MVDTVLLAIVILDIVAILRAVGWALFSVFRGVSLLELVYNYIYATIVLISQLLNIYYISTRERA